MQRDRPAASLLGRGVVKLDMIREAPLGVDHHRPCQLGDLAGAKASLDRQQNHDAIAIGISIASSLPQRRAKLLFRKRFGVLASHLRSQRFLGNDILS